MAALWAAHPSRVSEHAADNTQQHLNRSLCLSIHTASICISEINHLTVANLLQLYQNGVQGCGELSLK